MTAPQQLSDIDQAALSWFVANRGDDADAPGFARWQAADPRHGDAYARIENLWGSASFAGAAKRARPRHRGVAAATTLGLALCLTLGMGAGLRLTGTTLAWPADHATWVGQIAATTLADGSTVTLDSGSAIDVVMTDKGREIRVLRGRVFVAVAPDDRPLRVLSGDAEIRDIGTSFSVMRDDAGEHVAVADGVVDIGTPAAGARIVRAGQAGALVAGQLTPVRAINTLESFAWTQQRHYFSNQPVAAVADELRRYHRGWIVIANDRAAGVRISGGLNLSDPVAAMEELARLSGTRLTRVSDRVLILR
ncbi:FecR family protein [Croceibacterium xixiisoli]|nr:FecR domain-containing protein [Croceibacterium xixiisoli]